MKTADLRLSSFVFRRLAAIAVVCLLAFGLRVYHLGVQSLWYDEGLSVYLASLPPGEAIQTSALTDHPPLHALMLGAWMQIAGRSEFSVRFLSLWWSVLAVALTWRLGHELLTDTIGAIGALLMAASAFAVWYAQETRGYSLLLALTLIMAWAFTRVCPSPRSFPHRGGAALAPRSVRERGQGRGWAWVTLIASSIAALYTHYYAAFTLLALNLALLAVLACHTSHTSRSTQDAARFWLSQFVIVLGFAPWLPAAIRQAATNVTYFPGHVEWQTVVGDTLRAFATGDATPTAVAAWAVGVMGALVIIGALAEQPGTTRLNRVVAALLVAVPVAAMAVIAWQKPKFAPRYLMEALPAFYLLASAGIVAVWKWAVRPSSPPLLPKGEGSTTPLAPWERGWRRGALLVSLTGCICLLLITSALSLRATYFDPIRQRPDMRSVVAYIASNERPDDVIVLLSGHQSPVFDYYYRGNNTQYPIPNTIMPPAQSPLDYRAAQELEDIAKGYRRLWLVLWQRELADPTGIVMSELPTKAQRLGVGRDFHEMRLMLFDLQGHEPFGDGPQQATDIHFAEPIALVGYDLNAAARAPGESLELALYWRASGRIVRNYQVFTHLLAPDGQLIAGSDHIAGADNYPTSLWTEGTLIRNTFTLRVSSDVPPGEYAVEVGLYDSVGRLKLTGGTDRILLTEIVVK